jgi:hypothetical protein
MPAVFSKNDLNRLTKHAVAASIVHQFVIMCKDPGPLRGDWREGLHRRGVIEIAIPGLQTRSVIVS